MVTSRYRANMIRAPLAALALLTLSACGGGSDTEPLESAVRDYSDAYLGGDGQAAYDLMSERCQSTMTVDDMKTLANAAKDTYGELDIKSIDAEVDGDSGTVTYTYDVETLNQTDQPWVNEDGWRYDNC